MRINRRTLLKAGAASGLVAGLPGIVTANKNSTYRIALIGTGWWGMNIAQAAMRSGKCRMSAMCDVDRNQLAPACEKVEKLTGDKPGRYSDYRRLLEKEKPDIVIVATPDHWHALITIAAVQAGAHVYVEKPLSHTVNEGRAMVKAARTADRVVQVGLHRRTSPHCISAMHFLKQGKAGKIGMVRAFVHLSGGVGKVIPDSQPPDGLDWDMWCGPAPLRPFNRRIHPRGFRQFLDYANGQLGDWGVHWMDLILWWTDEKSPHSIFSNGGRHIKQDNTDAPDTQVVTYEFESFTATWEHRLYAGNDAEKHNIGCYFYGTEGTLHLGWRDGWTFYPAGRKGRIVHEEPALHEPDHQNIPELWADFIRAIEGGGRPASDIESGHRATSLSLLGMVSLKLGRSIRWDRSKEAIIDDPSANKLLHREYRKPWQYPQV